MKIVYLSNGSPYDKRTFSGISHYTFLELRRRYGDVHVIDTPKFDRMLVKAGRLHHLGILPPRHPLVAWTYARALKARLEAIRPDAIVCVQAEQKIVSFVDRWPCVLVTDAAVGTIVNYYPTYRTVSERSRRIADAQAETILHSRASVVMSSEWAAERAAQHYGFPSSRFVVAPFGANLDDIPKRADLPVGGPLKLLFVGYDWRRKGGEIALEAFRRIRRREPDAEFHIVGCRPRAALATPGVVVHGPLNKSDPRQAQTLTSLFQTSSFFFMPTRYEAYGVVYVEACAFGLPPVAGRTGGVSTIIRDEENGLLLPFDASPEAYADAILSVWRDIDRYRTMRRAARAAYEQRLNYRAWGDVIDSELRRITRAALDAPSSGPSARAQTDVAS